MYKSITKSDNHTNDILRLYEDFIYGARNYILISRDPKTAKYSNSTLNCIWARHEIRITLKV